MFECVSYASALELTHYVVVDVFFFFFMFFFYYKKQNLRKYVCFIGTRMDKRLRYAYTIKKFTTRVSVSIGVS